MNIHKFFVGRTIGFLILVVLVVAYVAIYKSRINGIDKMEVYTARDYKNAQYSIQGTKIKFIDGQAESALSADSESKIITKYFGNEIVTDLNNDGLQDVVFLLTQSTGGSGTYYYVVAAIKTDKGYVGSNGILLGDRIAPQSSAKGDGNTVIVNYADRALGEPFTTNPSIGKSMYLVLDPKTLQLSKVSNE